MCRFGVLALVLTLSLAVSGCSGNKLYPVKGKVVFKDGQPVTGGMVVFESTDTEHRASGSGPIQPDGSFALGLSRPGDGLPAGRYRAAVHPPVLSSEEEARGIKPLIDYRFRDLETAGLTFDVKAGPNNVTIEVTRPGERR